MKAPAYIADATYPLLRAVTGLMFWQHGDQKLTGWFNGEGGALSGLGSGDVGSVAMALAGILEFLGGLLILIGFKTRQVAFVLAGQMAVAYWWRHFPDGFWPMGNRGELAVLYCAIFLYLWTKGSGKWSVDAARANG
ncbi:MAG: DoxX family protein [Gemmatimonadetes bacterium]|nr:DoxX family protein [Gemmatimonadota bacterium]